MASDKFTFKQFEVWHDKCGMKVGTDGVLLGAWCDLYGCQSMLDVGSGTGLIALIAAQRHPQLRITAIDIMPEAVEQARENVERSPFGDRIEVVEGDFLSFGTSPHADNQHADRQKPMLFDAIVSNPPFYSADIHSPSASRDMARHSDSLPLDKLLEHASRLLSPEGRLYLILPFTAASDAIGFANMHGLLLRRRTDVAGNERVAPKRSLLEFWKTDAIGQSLKERLNIRNSLNEYTEEYKALTVDLYVSLK